MDMVRVAMIGCGGFQRYRLGNLAKVQQAEVVALVDPEQKQIDQTKASDDGRFEVRTKGANADSILYLVASGGEPKASEAPVAVPKAVVLPATNVPALTVVPPV